MNVCRYSRLMMYLNQFVCQQHSTLTVHSPILAAGAALCWDTTATTSLLNKYSTDTDMPQLSSVFCLKVCIVSGYNSKRGLSPTHKYPSMKLVEVFVVLVVQLVNSMTLLQAFKAVSYQSPLKINTLSTVTQCRSCAVSIKGIITINLRKVTNRS